MRCELLVNVYKNRKKEVNVIKLLSCVILLLSV